MAGSKSRTVLVVEDEPQVRQLIRRMLKGHGYKVLEAGSGPQAIDLATKHGETIDLALIDLGMPGMGGLDVANDLLPSRPGLKVLYISGMLNSVAVNSLAEGAPHLIVRKPFTSAELLQRIDEILP